LGGEAAARLLQRLAIPTSADTVLRLVRGLPPPGGVEAPGIVGVDDWALKKMLSGLQLEFWAKLLTWGGSVRRSAA
jgi:hypothetical protein